MINSAKTHEQIKHNMNKNEPHVKAGKLLTQLIEKDQKQLDLADLLKGSTSQQYTQPLIRHTDHFIKTGSIRMPDILDEAYDRTEDYNTFAGILPEIGRAWIAVDNILYLWDYISGTDVYRYDDQDQIIRDVGLVKPKPGVFGNHIQYVLVVTTPLEVILLGVGIVPSTTQGNTMDLFATDMSVPCDDIQMSSIQGTGNGRIIMCGSNGHIYELDYYHPDLWYSHCRLRCLTASSMINYLPRLPFIPQTSPKFKYIAIDDERNVLYAFSGESTIEVFYLGSTKNEFTSVAKKTDITNSAISMCRQNSMIASAPDFNIEYLHVVSTTESSKIHLVAVTESGFRLYFSHQRDALRTAYTYPSNIQMIPNALELLHVRLPPRPTTVNQTIQPYPKIFCSYYDCGVLLDFQKFDDHNDVVYMTSATVGDSIQSTTCSTNGYISQRPSLTETVTELERNGKVWAISEASTPRKGKYALNDIGSQLTDQPRKFLVFTDRGLTFFNKERPVDTLYHLLSESKLNPENSQRDLLTFFDMFGQTQACAMCLSIVCASYVSSSPEQDDIGRWAKQLFFDFGGHPSAAGPSPMIGNYLGQAVGQTGVIYSSKHDGLALYFARLISDIWKTKVFEISSGTNQADLSSRIQSNLFNVQNNLSRLKHFMDQNPDFHNMAAITNDRFQSNDHNALQLLLTEQQSVHDLYELLKQCIEAISFIDFVIDANVKDVLQCVPESSKNEIVNMTLESMLSSPQGVALKRELVIAAIYRYGSTHIHAGYDVVSDFLQRKCPSFFGASDMAFYKGVENLTCAHKADVDYERNIALDESLKYFKDAADSITDDKMTEICAEYRYQGYYRGVVKLALERARRLDPQEQGLAYMESISKIPLITTTADDPRVQFYDLRLRCYEQIFQSLAEVRQLQHGIKVMVKGRQIQVNHPDALANEVLSTALSCDDKLFHYTLYQRLLAESNNDSSMLTELLSVDTKYIVPFLKEYVNAFDGMNFLWQYYRRREQYYEAALYLEALAMETPDLSINKRLEYLGLAIVNARSRDPKHLELQESTQLLQRLEQQMEQVRTMSL
ncbi:Nup133 N terminal like-domain-containing protein [Halteromyces radiatus]|uniref:Nup133 N terminal like-domain-containing protein n=1 Tax=Halteromyces radiatus TaxID=101107 RepID=UPI00221FBE1C|nr:Nup133 N terminal like-domain-containing protein [Halteromyces radiatus]KAI8093448.1 Nup133 N terminal like-domain-containing protein [Halteromyces radiatus]